MTDDLVVVSGVSGGLGAEIARVLLSQGFRVAGISRKPNEKLNEFPGFTFYEQDLRRLDNIPSLILKIAENQGPIFGLVNNSAIGKDAILSTMHLTDIEDVVGLNLVSPMVVTKHALRSMLLTGRGRVINITSVVSRTGYKGLSVYASTKSGLEGFTKSLAREVGTRGITVNCVAPGFMETDMTHKLGESKLEKIKRRTSIGRLVRVSEAAETVGYLLSPLAEAITGQTIYVDGGS